MDDWPKTSLRTRVYGVGAVGGIVVSAVALIVAQSSSGTGYAASYVIRAVVACLVVGMIFWTASRPVLPLRDRVPWMLLGLGVLARAIAYVSLVVPDVGWSRALESGAPWFQLAGLVVTGAGLAVACVRMARGGRWPIWALTAAVTALTAGGALVAASAAPLPSVRAALTDADVYAIGLVMGDTALLALSAFCTLMGLRMAGGSIARPWLWVSAGLLMSAMADAVFPLLAPSDAADFAGLLWGYGFALTGIGATVMLDVLRPAAAPHAAPAGADAEGAAS